MGGLTGIVLNKEAGAIARVRLITILGISRNLYPWMIGQTLAGCTPHAIVTQGALPTHEVIDGAIESTIGFGAEETLLTVVI